MFKHSLDESAIQEINEILAQGFNAQVIACNYGVKVARLNRETHDNMNHGYYNEKTMQKYDGQVYLTEGIGIHDGRGNRLKWV